MHEVHRKSSWQAESRNKRQNRIGHSLAEAIDLKSSGPHRFANLKARVRAYSTDYLDNRELSRRQQLWDGLQNRLQTLSENLDRLAARFDEVERLQQKNETAPSEIDPNLVLEWDSHTVNLWLCDLSSELHQYGSIFESENISGKILLDISKTEMKEFLQIKSLRHRREIFNGINRLRTKIDLPTLESIEKERMYIKKYQSQMLPTDPSRWSNDEVCTCVYQTLESSTTPILLQSICGILRREKFTGSQFLALSERVLQTDLGIHCVSSKKQTLIQIESLRKSLDTFGKVLYERIKCIQDIRDEIGGTQDLAKFSEIITTLLDLRKTKSWDFILQRLSGVEHNLFRYLCNRTSDMDRAVAQAIERSKDIFYIDLREPYYKYGTQTTFRLKKLQSILTRDKFPYDANDHTLHYLKKLKGEAIKSELVQRLEYLKIVAAEASVPDSDNFTESLTNLLDGSEWFDTIQAFAGAEHDLLVHVQVSNDGAQLREYIRNSVNETIVCSFTNPCYQLETHETNLLQQIASSICDAKRGESASSDTPMSPKARQLSPDVPQRVTNLAFLINNLVNYISFHNESVFKENLQLLVAKLKEHQQDGGFVDLIEDTLVSTENELIDGIEDIVTDEHAVSGSPNLRAEFRKQLIDICEKTPKEQSTQEKLDLITEMIRTKQKKRSFNLRQKSILKSVDNLSPKTIAAVSPIKRDREMNRTKSVTFAFR